MSRYKEWWMTNVAKEEQFLVAERLYQLVSIITECEIQQKGPTFNRFKSNLLPAMELSQLKKWCKVHNSNGVPCVRDQGLPPTEDPIALIWFDFVKKELNWNGKLLVWWFIQFPTSTYDHEIWMLTKRSSYKATGMIFRRVAKLSLRDKIRSFVIGVGVGVKVKLLLIRIERR